MNSRRTALLALAVVGALALGACGAETVGTQDDPRTIEIDALDEFRFDPAEVTVSPGETIRFVVTNPGQVVHEFVLGPEEVQMAHEEASMTGEMGHGEMEMEGQLAALVLQPGETREVTVTFPESGQVVPYGCHEAGHWAAGMKGAVTIEG